jgi:hypothetical protein
MRNPILIRFGQAGDFADCPVQKLGHDPGFPCFGAGLIHVYQFRKGASS